MHFGPKTVHPPVKAVHLPAKLGHAWQKMPPASRAGVGRSLTRRRRPGPVVPVSLHLLFEHRHSLFEEIVFARHRSAFAAVEIESCPRAGRAKTIPEMGTSRPTTLPSSAVQDNHDRAGPSWSLVERTLQRARLLSHDAQNRGSTPRSAILSRQEAPVMRHVVIVIGLILALTGPAAGQQTSLTNARESVKTRQRSRSPSSRGCSSSSPA